MARTTPSSFARLKPGTFFDARGSSWIKCPGTLRCEDIVFNAYDADIDAADGDAIVQHDLFPDEILVRYDPSERRAAWSYEKPEAEE